MKSKNIAVYGEWKIPTRAEQGEYGFRCIPQLANEWVPIPGNRGILHDDPRWRIV